MALSTASGAPPIFLSRPYISVDSENAGDLIASTMQALVHRIYDMDPLSYWSSAGSNDATTETITAGLYAGAAQVSRTIDSIFLFNINFKNFKVEYSNDNGTTWTIVPGLDFTVSNLATPDKVVFLGSSIVANKLRLTMTTTQVANQDKTCGAFLAALSTFQPTRPPLAYKPKSIDYRKEVKLADGSIAYTYFKRSDASFTWYAADVVFDIVTSADKTQFDSIRAAADPFLWYAEPGDVTRSLYLSNFAPGTYKAFYSTQWKGAGWNVEFSIQELGGA